MLSHLITISFLRILHFFVVLLQSNRSCCSRIPGSRLPDYHLAKYITLVTQNITGSWAEEFRSKITYTPAEPAKKNKIETFQFTQTGHVALQLLEKDSAVPTKKEPSASGETPATVEAGAAPLAPANNNDIPAVTAARKIFNYLSQTNWIARTAKGFNKVEPNELDTADLIVMFKHAKQLVIGQRGVVRLTGPVWVIGDLNGGSLGFITTWRLFQAYATMAEPGTKLLFLGNLGSPQGAAGGALPIISLVVSAMVLYPDKVFYLCGSFEEPRNGRELQLTAFATTGNEEDAANTVIYEFFAQLPLFATIDERILAMHGGPCPELKKSLLKRGFDPSDAKMKKLRATTLQSAPNWSAKKFEKKRDGQPGYLFGKQAVDATRRKHRIAYIVRGSEHHYFGFLGALKYDGNGSFTMLHLITYPDFYKSIGEFCSRYDNALGVDSVFSDTNTPPDEPVAEPKSQAETPTADATTQETTAPTSTAQTPPADSKPAAKVG
ncbi:unnamed protein product, partial [Mesorhabditis spiculigera]